MADKISQIEHRDLAESRMASEFSGSINLIGYIRALITESDNLEQVFQDLLYKRSIDTAFGVQLDILGSLIGQSRELIDADLVGYFSYQGVVEGLGFGDLNDPSVGGRYISLNEPTSGTRVLSDDEYRVFLRARTIKNSTRSTVNEILDMIVFVLDAEKVVMIEGHTSYSIAIGKVLSVGEKGFINGTDLIPKTLGVGVTYSEFDPASYFAYDLEGSGGYGDLNNISIGGKYASLL